MYANFGYLASLKCGTEYVLQRNVENIQSLKHKMLHFGHFWVMILIILTDMNAHYTMIIICFLKGSNISRIIYENWNYQRLCLANQNKIFPKIMSCVLQSFLVAVSSDYESVKITVIKYYILSHLHSDYWSLCTYTWFCF